MKAVTFGVLLILAAVSANPRRQPHYDLRDAPALFEKFIRDYGRHYKDEADRNVHYQAFVQNLKKINEDNANQDSATFDINKFADFTDEEFKKLTGLVTPKNSEIR